MLDKVNVAFVGCGGMAAHYLPVYRDLDWVRVVCCVDVDPGAAALPQPRRHGLQRCPGP
ncbi:hypothetical protein SBA3_300013 [Candidatus Sulfopaludibacter sp. SbA3]|nr:hypothetical protein SBA3_300013 [Candidatus Sulfopaludibacter sp. SbA3]